MKLKILLVDDHAIVREGLKSLIEKEEDLQVVAEAADGRQAVELALRHHPDLVVMDISMPEINGVVATRMIREKAPNIKVLALSMETDRRFVVEVLKSGASGYLLKDAAFGELATAIRRVATGETFLGNRISDILIRDYLQKVPQTASASSELLSQREREVLQLISQGKSSKEIAFQFEVSTKTVDNHRHAIMKKLNLYSIAELTKYAVREGLSNLID